MRVPAAVRATAFASLICGAAALPLAAQRPDSTRMPARDSVRADAAAAAPAGPRIPAPRWRSVEPALSRTTAAANPAMRGSATFHFTTLELILIGVIVALLIFR